MAKAKNKAGGRPKGTPNAGSDYTRDETLTGQRVSRGFLECLEEIKTVAGYKSKADVLHDALEILANKKLPDSFYWRGKIQ